MFLKNIFHRTPKEYTQFTITAAPGRVFPGNGAEHGYVSIKSGSGDGIDSNKEKIFTFNNIFAVQLFMAACKVVLAFGKRK